MPEPSLRKSFSVERQSRGRVEGVSGGVSNGDILDAIGALREDVAALGNGRGNGEELSPPAAGSVAAEAELQDAKDVRVEIAQMVRSIALAKTEIAAIKHPNANPDRISTASSQLDAIVSATEAATNDIIGASEAIEELTKKIAEIARDDQEVVEASDQIARQLVTILEACNFQDVTGQRVSKVVKTLRYIEDRILAMIGIWGPEAFADLPVAPDAQGDDERDLLNGPQLANEGIGQDEIDALFD